MTIAEQHGSAPITDFASGFDQGIRQAMRQNIETGVYNGVMIDPHQHPEFHKGIEAVARRAGLKRTPIVLVLKELPFSPVWAHTLPNALAIPSTVMINEPIMKMTEASIHHYPTAKMEGLLAHEFSHLKDGFSRAALARLSPITIPIAAMAALHLYDKAQLQTPQHKNQSQKEYNTQLAEKINGVATDEMEALNTSALKEMGNHGEWQVNRDWTRQYIDAGRYLAVAALGIGAGLMIARKNALTAEFRADKLAAEITNPEEFKSLLKGIDEAQGTFWQNCPAKAQTVRGAFKEKLYNLIEKTIFAHPKTTERLDFIDRVAQERRIGATQVGIA